MSFVSPFHVTQAKTITFLTVYWCDGKGDYPEYYLFFQIHRHDCFENLKEHPK